jgi:hypothetical protein
MPWNECKPMDERLKFIARLLDGEKMAPMCREFGISRVTGVQQLHILIAGKVGLGICIDDRHVRVLDEMRAILVDIG